MVWVELVNWYFGNFSTNQRVDQLKQKILIKNEKIEPLRLCLEWVKNGGSGMKTEVKIFSLVWMWIENGGEEKFLVKTVVGSTENIFIFKLWNEYIFTPRLKEAIGLLSKIAPTSSNRRHFQKQKNRLQDTGAIFVTLFLFNFNFLFS